MKILKTVVGQNVNITIETDDGIMKYSKRFADKELKSKFVETVQSIQTSIDKAKSSKVRDKHLDTLIGMFTENTKIIEAEQAKTDLKVKGTKKHIKRIDKAEKNGNKKEKKYEIGELKKITKALSAEESEQLVIIKTGMALKGFESIPMPKLLVEKIKEFTKRGVSIQFLINFWYKCLANPNHIARTKLFDYLVGQNIIITPSGNFVTYRMVKDCNKNGKKLDGYYTDAHTYTMRYYEGTVCFIPRSECDEDGANDCSKGLNVAPLLRN